MELHLLINVSQFDYPEQFLVFAIASAAGFALQEFGRWLLLWAKF